MAGELGDWTLKFTVDATGIAEATSGVQQLESAVEETTNKSASFGKELGSIKKSITGLGSDFIMLGAVASGAIGGLAAMAPSLAGNFANLGIATRNLGESLAGPIGGVIDTLTNALNGFATWFNQNPEAANWLVTGLTAIAALGVVGLVIKIGENVLGTLDKLWDVANWVTGGKLGEIAMDIKGTIGENLLGFWNWAKTGIITLTIALVLGKALADVNAELDKVLIEDYEKRTGNKVEVSGAVGRYAVHQSFASQNPIISALTGVGYDPTRSGIGIGSNQMMQTANFGAFISDYLLGGNQGKQGVTINAPINVEGTVISESYLSDLVARLFRMAQNQYG